MTHPPRPAEHPTEAVADPTGTARSRLDRSFFLRDAPEVAPDLLGRVLAVDTGEGTVELRLTEVEAYFGANDPGSHARNGRTARNASMFGPPGHLYVYFTYGMHYCANVVCSPDGTASGVLLRGGEVLTGHEIVARRRATARRGVEYARGPARLASALGLDLTHDAADLCAPGDDAPMRILHGTPPAPDLIGCGPRTGVGGAGADTPWRFYIEGDPTVSPYRAHVPRRRARPAGDAPNGPAGGARPR
ncbi:DNA-3-methyladenine glycosylase [Allostreptomyces psammosilenae]|uniref:Putative 3-methyladenine DNA glycosylase n=1 Tax=Allostreptomyces psammosilenae TaxID=1892865 RepID=A0A852ZYJ3_9ACTN|nr:DNA-3-methyladenine glycosylase [Allostreptomyces psammosilenae]NYI03352.1 DNA-3-methyladenine glycosylase [Allostreptomyces psammosilenae]